jgi:hypothetical protein
VWVIRLLKPEPVRRIGGAVQYYRHDPLRTAPPFDAWVVGGWLLPKKLVSADLKKLVDDVAAINALECLEQ